MSRGLHKLTGGRFYHLRAECRTCEHREPTAEWEGFCRARNKALCCEAIRASQCKHYKRAALSGGGAGEGE